MRKQDCKECWSVAQNQGSVALYELVCKNKEAKQIKRQIPMREMSCTVEGCKEKRWNRDLCVEHYSQKIERKRILGYNASKEDKQKLREKKKLLRKGAKEFYKIMEKMGFPKETQKAMVMDGILLDKRLEELGK